MADYNTAQRKAMASRGEALSDGSFPIADCQDAENAIRDLGRTNNTAAARAHIKRRVSALSCSGTFFDNWRA
jgi:hypothetical protein